MTESYQQAVKLFERKDYHSAEEILVNLRSKGNVNTEVSYFLAVVKSILGDYIGAELLYREVILYKPDHTEACYNLALCLHNQQKKEEALTYYKKVLEQNPFLSEALNNIAIIYKDMGKYDKAEDAFKKAIKSKPDNKSALSNLSDITISKDTSLEARKILDLLKNNDYSEAEKLLLNLVEKQPENIDLLRLLGITYFKLKKYDEASGYFKKIISSNENDAESIYNLGVCCQHLDDHENALKHYKRTIEINPGNVEALNNLGLIYAGLNNTAEAEKYYELALNNNPEYPNALLNLGGIKLNDDKFEEATEYFGKALSVILKNNNDINQTSMAYANIGLVYYRLKNMNEALKYFTIAAENDPENIIAHYNKAEALFMTGRYEEGWKEYEWRIDRKEFGKRKFNKSIDPDYDLKGKKVLVYAEQGLGDALQFIRYIPVLKEKGCYVIFECEKQMHALIDDFEEIDKIIERDHTKEPDINYDFAIPLLSLPLYLKIFDPGIPEFKPYIKSDAELVNRWSPVFKGSDKFKIGIIWAGSPTHTNDRNRSVKLRQLSPLFSIEGTGFYSLQKGIPAIQVRDYQLMITDLDNGIKSFADTAAIIENLDLVITVDTSVAHLAGAMGKETWVLLPYVPDWRWGEDGDTTIWYPTMKLYRQPALKDWNSVFVKLKKDLAELVNEKKQQYINTDASIVSNNPTIYLGLASGENFGWGVCSKYLKKELSKKLSVINIDENEELIKEGTVKGTMVHALNNNDFSGLFPVRGIKNIGYTFFEYELNRSALNNAVDYDVVLGGSTWNVQKLREKGVNNSDVLVQGVDPELFYPGTKAKTNDLFIIFSGGKFELRKGQDLVLKAIKILQRKYSDIILINAWYNMWPATMNSMNISKHIKYEYKGETWKNFMINICRINEIDGEKIFTLPITPNNKLRDLYLSSDIGLFPNRCEGGTNLVLMEYMACGKPVIASYNSGHKDILTDENSIKLERMHEFKLFGDDKILTADWEEPDIDEIISKLEYAYHNRDVIKQIGDNAGEFMKNFTWKNSAEALIKFI